MRAASTAPTPPGVGAAEASVPPTMVTDDSKEQTKGEFHRKLKGADCLP
jgi:hypothetical protein